MEAARESIKTESVHQKNTKAYLACNQCGGFRYQFIRTYPDIDGTDVVECESCKLMQTQPTPSDEFLFNYYQSTFGKDPVCGFDLADKSEAVLSMRPVLQFDFIQKFLKLTKDTRGRILDVGCHAGCFLALFKKKGWDVVGVDPNPGGRLGEKWFGIKILEQLFKKNMFPENSFDAILHSHALEHVPDPKWVLTEFHKILRPGGWVFIEVPNESVEKVKVEDIFSHLYFFTPQTLAAMARSVGFEVVATRVFGIGWRPKKILSAEGFRWLGWRWKARYDARGRLNPLTMAPFFGRFFKEDRYYKDQDPDANALRILLRKPVSAS